MFDKSRSVVKLQESEKNITTQLNHAGIRVNLNIPVTHFHNLLSWDKGTIDWLVDSAVEVAVKVGLRLDGEMNKVYLKEVESKGVKIDWNSQVAIFTRKQVEDTMDVMRKTLPAPRPLRPLSVSDKGKDERFMVGNGANLLFDWNSWQAKAPLKEDLIELCQWAQGSDDVESLFPPVMLKDIDQRLGPIYSYALMAKYCRKKIWHEQPTEPIHVRYLDKMAHVVEKHRGYYQPMQEWEYINPPFRIGRRAIATMLERVDSGICNAMGIGPMSVAGMSAPVTVSGLAVTALAEILAGLTFFRILRPGFGLRAFVCTGSLDLRTARVSYFSLHTHLCNLATWELLVRGIGADSSCTTFYRDANEPGMQALYEFGMTQAFFSSILNRCRPEIGGLACGNIFSPHQAVLDMEAIKEFNEILYGFEVCEEMMGIDEITNAGFEQGVHMSTEHTLRYMKDGIPFSGFLFRGLPAGAQHDKSRTQTDELIEKAVELVEDAKIKGRKVEPDVKLGNELYDYVKEAASKLGIEAPPLT